ncbi:hypothetical protein BC830DRAFT_1078533 [Chytriomyces sp. MP71]|nr:hypothetical protein BC830DRAFT_1078533 [Chytriomyces sp. MP71]
MTAAECVIINTVFPTIFTNPAPGCCSLYPKQLTCNAQGNIISICLAGDICAPIVALPDNCNQLTGLTCLKTLKINKFKLDNCKLVDHLFDLPLTLLDLSDNGLTGSIPSSVGSFAGDTLDLSKNNFEGTIPDAILNSASTVSLAENSFTGPLPAWPQKSRTTVLDVSYNYITGMIPANYLSKLTDLDITSNFLYGPAPTVSKKHTLERDENCFDDQTLKSKKLPRNSDCCDSGNLGDDRNCGDCGIACKKKSFCLNNDHCGKKPKAR